LQCFKKLRRRHDQLHGWKSHMRGYSLMTRSRQDLLALWAIATGIFSVETTSAPCVVPVQTLPGKKDQSWCNSFKNSQNPYNNAMESKSVGTQKHLISIRARLKQIIHAFPIFKHAPPMSNS